MSLIKREIGYAGDLFNPPVKYFSLTGGYGFPEHCLITLGDLLIMHQKVYLRADATNLRQLFRGLEVWDVEELIKAHRIGFFRPSLFRDADYYSDLERKLFLQLNDEKGWM